VPCIFYSAPALINWMHCYLYYTVAVVRLYTRIAYTCIMSGYTLRFRNVKSSLNSEFPPNFKFPENLQSYNAILIAARELYWGEPYKTISELGLPFDHRVMPWRDLKFRDDISNSSGVIALTDKQSQPQTDSAENNTTLATLRSEGVHATTTTTITRSAWQSQTWGRPAPQIRVRSKFT